VGANDPERFSNTKLFYDLGWSGIVIEPNPVLAERFRKCRPRDTIVECGVSSEAGKLLYYCFDDPALNTFSLERSDEILKLGTYTLERRVQVPVSPLGEILRRYYPTGKHIDVLTVDVEGLDIEVLRSHDWLLFPPSFVVAEYFVSDLRQAIDAPIASLLRDLGFTLVSRLGHSAIFANDRRQQR
jgi:FkbM family methyltransferase